MSWKRRRLCDEDRAFLNNDEVEVVVAPQVVSSARSTNPWTNPGNVSPPPAALEQPVLDEIPHLLLVELQQNDANAVAAALRKLARLLFVGGKIDIKAEFRKKDAMLLGAPTIVVLILRKWQMHEKIQLEGLGCLCRLSYQSTEGIRAITRAGGLEAGINALKVFPNSLVVQTKSCVALANMLHGSSTVSQMVAQRFIEDLNGMALVMKAMDQFPQAADLQKSCCRIFGNILSEKRQYVSILLNAGVVRAVAPALEHSDEAVRGAAKMLMELLFSSK